MTKSFMDANGRALPIFRALSTETVAYTGSAAASQALDSQVRLLRVWATTDCFVVVGNNPTADNGDMPLAAKVAEYIPINEGDKISAIQISGSGNLHVTGLL